MVLLGGTRPLFLWSKRRFDIRYENRAHRINEEIRFPRVRLVDEEGNMVGIVPIEDAQQKAYDANLDLVLVSPSPDNPVCKIMDYGKFTFEQDKRKREARRNQKIVKVKEVQLKLTTEKHDFDVRVRNAKRFLEAGDRVKVVIRFRGREMTHMEQGYDVMEEFAEAVADVGVIDRAASAEGRHMIMFLSPLKD
ncbi:MAG TPA: translation initiation factor IF-3 [Bacillota bacterium]|nr:translation initiation factor IF-3 [Bacillota bacterium]HQC49222.1 translation initiation factor IF-3 [Bacillota bacterium]